MNIRFFIFTLIFILIVQVKSEIEKFHLLLYQIRLNKKTTINNKIDLVVTFESSIKCFDEQNLFIKQIKDIKKLNLVQNCKFSIKIIIKFINDELKTKKIQFTGKLVKVKINYL